MPQTCLHLFNGLIFCYPFMSSNSGTIELKFDAPKYIFSTPAGHRLAHSTLRPQLPYDPHDAQLEGICKAVDGINIMVLTPTGSGKTGYLTMYILFMISLANPKLVAPAMKKVCQNPVVVMVFPTNGVEGEMVRLLQPLRRISLIVGSRSSSSSHMCWRLMPTQFRLRGFAEKTSG